MSVIVYGNENRVFYSNSPDYDHCDSYHVKTAGSMVATRVEPSAFAVISWSTIPEYGCLFFGDLRNIKKELRLSKITW